MSHSNKAFLGLGVMVLIAFAIYLAQSSQPAGDSTAAGTCTVKAGSTSGFPVNYAGIYVLGPGGGDLDNITQANNPWMDGWSTRSSWIVLDTGTNGPNYQYANIDSAIAQLQPWGKKLSLTIEGGGVPAYVLNANPVETWDVDLNSYVGKTVVPWDPNALTQYTNFINALGNHLVCDTSTGNTVPLKSHPALAGIRVGIIGAGRLRQSEISDVFSTKTYNRTSFINAITNTINATRNAFPNTKLWVAYFNLDDGNNNPSLDSVATAAIAPMGVGFFQELLRGDSPNSGGNFGKNLTTGNNLGGFTAFQACGSWVNHSPCTFTTGDDAATNGLSYGYGQFGARYYELYKGDVLDNSIQNLLLSWHNYLASPSTKPSPQTLTVTSAGSGKYNLSWADINGLESGYKIERATNSGGPWTTINTTNPNVTSYTDSGLGSGTYYYRVHGYNAGGLLAYSDIVSTSGAPVGDTTPPVISSPTAGSITSNSANITWTTNEGSDSQVDYGTTASYGNTTSLNPSLITNHSIGLTSLVANTTYHYRVKSKDASGNLAQSSDLTFKTTSTGGGGGGGSGAKILQGYAWSSTIGWISFNTTVPVTVSTSTGNLSGYAWSSNIGWLKFGNWSTTGDMPSGSGTTRQNAKLTGSNITGWARFCAGLGDVSPTQTTPNNSCGGTSRTDGWEGWLSLSGTGYGVVVTATPGPNPGDYKLGNYAWGSDVVGWVDMSGVTIGGEAPVTPPNPALSLDFTAGIGCTYNANLSWSPEDNTTYLLQRNRPNPTITIPSGVGYATDPNLSPATIYKYTLTATNSAGTIATSTQKTSPSGCPSSSQPPFIGSFLGIPPVVDAGTKCDLTWSGIQNVDINSGGTCTITGPGAGFPYSLSTTTDGSKQSAVINATTRYTLTCSNGIQPDAVVITQCSLKPKFIEF